MQHIKVSIITVCFNSGKTIERTIQSVIEQTYSNIEYIIVDGGSKDNTVSVIKHYQDLYPNLIKYVSEKDRGIYDAMNKGIAMSTGDLIGIINSDDWYEPNAVEKAVAAYNSDYKYQVIYGAIRLIENGIEKEITLKSHEFLEEQMIMHPSTFVSKLIYQDLYKYNLEYKYSADYDLMLYIKQNREVHFIKIYDVIANFTLGGSSSAVDALIETYTILKKYNLMSKRRYLLKVEYLKFKKLLKRG